MDSIPWVIGLGLLLGVQHATDPDHVVAVATIASREPRFLPGALIGVLWGVGHMLTLSGAGGIIVLLNLSVPASAALAVELAVALTLVALGALRLFWTLRGTADLQREHLTAPHDHGHRNVFHAHLHTHGGVTHRHAHVHPPRRLLAALRTVGRAQGLRAVGIGVLHGLAGSAALALLVLSTVRNPWLAVAYLGVFGCGTVAGMTTITAALTVPFALTARRFGRVNRALCVGTGLLSVGVGFFLVYRIGLVEGLFTGGRALH